MIAADGTERHYDRLLLATGSIPFILPVPGNDLPGVITYRDIADTEAMIDTAEGQAHAVVIGGGLLGLEAANGLKLRGMDVTVVHLLDTLMERQLDPVAAGLLQNSLRSRPRSFCLEAVHRGDRSPTRLAKCPRVRFSDGSEHAGRSGRDGRRASAPTRTRRESRAALQPRRRRERHDADLRPAHLRRGRVRQPSRHRLRPGGAAVRAWRKSARPILPHYGIGRYQGSVTSTKLKVTGIDLFSAGDFVGGEGTEHITLSDPAGGVYKKLVLKDDKLVGAVLYGDTVDGAWYFKLLQRRPQRRRPARSAHVRRKRTSATPATRGRAAPCSDVRTSMEVCGCNGVCKGTIVKAIREQKLYTLDEVQKAHQSLELVRLVHRSRRADPDDDAGRRLFRRRPRQKPMCDCTELHARRSAQGDPRTEAADHRRGDATFSDWRTPNGCATCRPALNYYLLSTWPHEALDDPQSRFINERAHANIQKDGTFSVIPRMWGGVTNASELRAHRRRRRQVRGCRR